MWFDERNLPLTFRIKLVKDYPYAEKKKRRKEKRIYFSMQKLTCLDIYVYIYIHILSKNERNIIYLRMCLNQWYYCIRERAEEAAKTGKGFL